MDVVDRACDVMDEAIVKIDELRAERDSALLNWKALQKAVDDADLCQLLDELDEYMGDRADADGDSEGFYPNAEMRLQGSIKQALAAFGWEA